MLWTRQLNGVQIYVPFPQGKAVGQARCRCRPILRIRVPFVKFESCPSPSSPHLTFPNLGYIKRLEVYMVNSPSWPNLRPVDPPPLGASIRHALPLPRPATHPARGGDGSSPRSWMLGVAASADHQGRIKAKNPLIVHNQGISRHRPNSRSASLIGRSHPQTRQPLHSGCRPVPIRPQQPIKAKTPAIVHHQGISRHPQKNTRPLRRMVLGPSLELLRPLPFASLRLCVKTPSSRHDQGSIKAKTPAIKAHRASSRQTTKK